MNLPPIEYIERKTLLYKTGVEYGDYTINHVLGCSHGCLYPCYAFMMAKRFGKIKSYEEWLIPKLVINAPELLEREIPKYRKKVQSVQFCFTTDPFMYGYNEVGKMSLRLIAMLNDAGIKCTILTKGILPNSLASLSSENECGITLVSLNEEFRQLYEPYSASYQERIQSLLNLHKQGVKTWVSIEPYPTPNIIQQDIKEILNSIGFVDKLIFGRMNYNSLVSKYPQFQSYYNELSREICTFADRYAKQLYIKKGTVNELEVKQRRQ